MQLRHIAFGFAGLLPLVLAGCGGSSSPGVGKAADKAKASRTIEIRQLDTHRFDPAAVQVKAGETVTLRIRNTGTQIHEFTLGDPKTQTKREKDMKAMGPNPMKMDDATNDVTIDPGASKEITWTFPKKGTVDFGCHEPGHYLDGMRGTVTVG